MLEGIYGRADRAGVLGRVRSTEYSEARDSKPKARSAGWLAGAKGAEGNEMQACLGRGKAACRSLNGILSRGRATRVFVMIGEWVEETRQRRMQTSFGVLGGRVVGVG